MENKTKFLKIFLLFLTTSLKFSFAADWSYGNVDSWAQNYETCGGNMQSPINLSKMTKLPEPILELNDYKSFLAGPIKLTNNGHSINIEPTNEYTQNLTLANVVGDNQIASYKPKGMHFHWGSKGKLGSEHAVDNKRYNGEIHIVHQSISENAPTELIVFGIFIKVVKNAKKSSLSKIFDNLPKLKRYNSTIIMKNGLNVEQILKNADPTKYYTYRGSLTTPPCSEIVTWFVFMNVVKVSQSEISKFFNLKDSHGKPLISTYRPVQPLGDRTISYYE